MKDRAVVIGVFLGTFCSGIAIGLLLGTGGDKQVDKLMSQCNNQLQKENAPRKTTCELTYKFVEKK